MEHFFEEYLAPYGYAGIFFAIIATGFGLPMPEEIPILTAGVMVGHADTLKPGQTELDPARLRWWVMLPVCVLAVVVGDGCLYAAGRYYGPRLLANGFVRRRLLSDDKRTKIEQNFRDRGVLILLTARLTPGIRTPIFLMAGVLRVPFGRFLLADGLYAIPGVNVMFWLSYFLGNVVRDTFHKVEPYRSLILFGVLSAVVGVILYRIATNRKVTTGTQADVPIYNKPVEKVTEAAEHAVEAAIKRTIDVVSGLSHGDKPAEPAAQPKSDPPVPG